MAAAGDDKKLSADEVRAAVKGVVPGGKKWCHKPKVDDVIKFFDADKNGKVNLDEFLKGMGKVAEHLDFKPGPEDVEAAKAMFRRGDADGNGRITRKEVRAALNHLYSK